MISPKDKSHTLAGTKSSDLLHCKYEVWETVYYLHVITYMMAKLHTTWRGLGI